MATITTWSYVLSVQGWTSDSSESSGTGSGTMAHNVAAEALRNTMAVSGVFPGNQAVIENNSPLLNISIQIGDSVSWDFSASSDAKNVGKTLTIHYTDATTDISTVTGSGAATLSKVATVNKTLDHIEVQFDRVGDGTSNSFTIDTLEVRLTTAALPGEYDIEPAGTLDGILPGVLTHAFSPNQSGEFLFFAMEDTSGNQMVLKVLRPTSTTPTVLTVYNPLSGTAGNIASTGDPNRMIWHGNFGTDVGVVDHAITAATNTDISPSSIGAELIQPLQVDLSDINHIVAINRNDQDALETDNLGGSYATLNTTLGQSVDAMDLAFFGAYFPFGGFFGGNDGADENLEYTPNEFADLREDTSTALKAVGSIVSIDIALDT